MYSRKKQQQPEEESIYNLIQQQEAPPSAAPMYRSRYPPNAPPTGSTFGHGQFSQVNIGNLAGDYEEFVPSKHPHAMWGPRSDIRPDPTSYLKKHTRYDPALGMLPQQSTPYAPCFEPSREHDANLFIVSLNVISSFIPYRSRSHNS